MKIEKLSLLQFRNLKPLELELKGNINIFYGNNAQGKTNILESVYMCATGKSFRTKQDGQLVQFGTEEAHIRLLVKEKKIEGRIDVHLRKNEKKGIAVNGMPIKKYGDLYGALRIVLFSPEELQMIKSGPSERRRFLDLEICQLSAVYYYDLKQYYKVLRQRNQLLKKMGHTSQIEELLYPWDQQLITFGKKVIQARWEFVEKLKGIVAERHAILTDGSERLELFYRPNVEASLFAEKLQRHLDRDIQLRSSSVGPHKDDLQFFINGNDVKIFGSQGQQRSTALSLKLAEVSLIYQETKEMPVLLLDDVLSELDEKRQKFLFHQLGDVQLLITCTGIEDAVQKVMAQGAIFLVQDGAITEYQ